MGLGEAERAELRALVNCKDVSAVVATRARIVLWMAEGDGGSTSETWPASHCPRVDRWVERYEQDGVAGLVGRSHAAPRDQVPAWVPARIVVLTRQSPVVNDGGLHYQSPTTEQTIFDVPAGNYSVLICGRGFINHGWPGSITPGDVWQIQMRPSADGPVPVPSRIKAWQQPESQ